MKRVTVALKVDSEFIKGLNLNVGLKRDRDIKDVAQVLAEVFLMEARGATEEQVHATIPIEWRPHIEAVSSLRAVEESPHG